MPENLLQNQFQGYSYLKLKLLVDKINRQFNFSNSYHSVQFSFGQHFREFVFLNAKITWGNQSVQESFRYFLYVDSPKKFQNSQKCVKMTVSYLK